MKIYTLNVNGFRGAEMQPGEYVSPQDLRKNLHNFITLIGDIIVDDQSVLIVQEFPHMNGDRSGRWFRWVENDFHNECLETIRTKYRVIMPSHLIKSEQCTIAICKETSSWKRSSEEIMQYDSKHSYSLIHILVVAELTEDQALEFVCFLRYIIFVRFNPERYILGI